MNISEILTRSYLTILALLIPLALTYILFPDTIKKILKISLGILIGLAICSLFGEVIYHIWTVDFN